MINKDHPDFSKREEENKVVNDLVKALELMKPGIATNACIAYLRRCGYICIMIN